MQNPLIELVISLAAFGIPIITLFGAFLIGSWQEKRHFASLKEAEARYADIMVTDLKRLPANWHAKNAGLVCGEVVIANDKFKIWMAGWIKMFGGRIFTYETLNSTLPLYPFCIGIPTYELSICENCSSKLHSNTCFTTFN